MEANITLILGVLIALFFLGAAVYWLKSKPKELPKQDDDLKQIAKAPAHTIQEKLAEAAEQPVKPVPVPTPAPKVSWTERLGKGMARSRKEVWGKLSGLFSGAKLDSDTLSEIEELLYGADLGPTMVAELIQEIETKARDKNMNETEFKLFLFEFLKQKIASVQTQLPQVLFEPQPGIKTPQVIMIVGVNGAGKTTTIGKLATRLTRQGAKVTVGACDTFRAAAVDQLQVWCERAGAEMVRAKEGSSPSGVGFEALQKAMQNGSDYCILDTAGRLHTKENLMDELKKSKTVLTKLMPEAPQHTLLVLDAITGQNALRQAEEFHKYLSLTGLIFTKCDGSSKAGSAVGIVKQLQVPIAYIGVGETVEDLDRFGLDEYLSALLGLSSDSEVSGQLRKATDSGVFAGPS